MNFRKMIDSAKVYQKQYDFYTRLGYSPKAAELLSVITYGESELAEFMRRFQGENAIARVHDWLAERPEEDPWQAIRNAMQEQRRKTLVKDVKATAEGARVAIRNIRREAIEKLKSMKKASEITEDDLKDAEEDVQKLTDDFIKQVENVAAKKEEEIMAI